MRMVWGALGFLSCGTLIALGVLTISDPKDAQRIVLYLSKKGFFPLLDEHIASSPVFRTYLIVAGTISSLLGIVFAVVIVVAMFS